jgi:hypothetical protein
MTHRKGIGQEDRILTEQNAFGPWREEGIRVERVGSGIVDEDEQSTTCFELGPVGFIQ